jgi:hypothetical protein
MQLFRDLGGGGKTDPFALEARFAQNVEDRRDCLVNILREPKPLGWRGWCGFLHRAWLCGGRFLAGPLARRNEDTNSRGAEINDAGNKSGHWGSSKWLEKNK